MDLDTPTVAEQRGLEAEVASLYSPLLKLSQLERLDALSLKRETHVQYVLNGLKQLPASFVCLEASRTWICFWLTHSLAMLGADLEHDRAGDVVDFIRRCQHPRGGFGGGPGQIPHVAPTYAALACLATLDHPSALSVIDREALWDFLTRMVMPPEKGGGFAVHEGGEADLRACYCAVAAATLAGLDAKELAKRAGLAQYVRSCQTFEGGLGGEPGNEAHGGYSYCGLAALVLVGEAEALDLPRFAHWAVHMQGELEGGFRGRTNKLVDGCYSFWQGGLFPLLRAAGVDPLSPPSPSPAPTPSATSSAATALLLDFPRDALVGVDPLERRQAVLRAAIDVTEDVTPETEALMDDIERLRAAAHRLFHDAVLVETDGAEDAQELYSSTALQAWLLACSQMEGRGGLRDKPGKYPDYYHTCYCLSGLAAAQGYGGLVLGPEGGEGGEGNALERTDARLNICLSKLRRLESHWGKKL